MIELAITLGLIFSLLPYEVFGLAAGVLLFQTLHSVIELTACRNLNCQPGYIPHYKSSGELYFSLRQTTDGDVPARRLLARKFFSSLFVD
jgi:hypothetical protein